MKRKLTILFVFCAHVLAVVRLTTEPRVYLCARYAHWDTLLHDKVAAAMQSMALD